MAVFNTALRNKVLFFYLVNNYKQFSEERMRIVTGYLLREIAGIWVVIPVGERVVQLNGIISLSESGALLWKRLEKDAEKNDLVQLLTDEYDVSQANAITDVEIFLDLLKAKGLLL